MGESLGTTYGLTRRHAAYTPGEPRPICPVCFSRPNLDWGSGRQDASEKQKQGFGTLTLVDPLRIKSDDGSTVEAMVTEAQYRCSNESCKTAMLVAFCHKLSPCYHPGRIRKHRLNGRALTKFEAGYIDAKGVFQGESLLPLPKPEPVRKQKRIQKKVNAPKKSNPAKARGKSTTPKEK